MMHTVKSPDQVLEAEGFVSTEPFCAIALMAACARSNVLPGTLDREDASLVSLHPDALQAYIANLREMASFLYGSEAVEHWREAVDNVQEASKVARAFSEAGLLNSDCERVLLQQTLAEVTPVERSWAELPASTEEKLEFVDPPPFRPLVAAQNELELLLMDANDRPLTDAERSRALALLQTITGDEILALFAAAVSSMDADEGPSLDRDLTLLDALSMRELAGELFALEDDEALLAALRTVDQQLDDPRYRDALLSVDASLWRLDDEPRLPSEHWWGVRTRAEMFGGEFASEIADALAAQGAHEEALFAVIRGAITEALTTAAHKVHQSLDAVAQALRSAVDTLALPTPLPAYGWRSKDDDEIPAPLTWQVPNSNCVAILSFPPRALLRADTALRMSIWDAPGVVRRVALGDLVRRADTTETESFALFTLEELQQARQLGTHGIGGLGIEVEIDGKPRWIAGILPIN